MALPRKQMKFKSPYKGPIISLDKKPQKHQEEASSTTEKTRTCTVKIKPIDPFKFCESITEKSKKNETKSFPAFQKSLKAQVSIKTQARI